MSPAKSNLDEFAATLLDLARHDRDILVVTSDSRGSGRLTGFAKALPDQLIEVGIAEQNLVGICAGLAAAGKKVFGVSPASFLTARALEQIKNDVGYSNQPVRLIGISAGVSYGALGSTHHAIHDFAVLRAIHNIAILAPADNHEAREAIRAAVAYPGPVYVRFGKRPMPDVHSADTPFSIGRAIRVLEGHEVTFIATGEPLAETVAAADMLRDEGIGCRVLSMHTLKPFDADALLYAAHSTRALVTVEEHSVHGGLGECCAAILMQAGVHVPFKIVGFPDEYTVTGSQAEIFAHYGITAAGLADTARTLLGVAARA